MILRKLFLACLLLISTITIAQQKDTSFTKEWIRIDTLLLNNGLTKTALEKVNQLYVKAVARNLPAQKIKCLIYRYSLESTVTENGPLEIAGDLQKQIETNTDPVIQSIFRLLLIKELQQYFQNNRWNIYTRKSVSNNQNPDINTWTIDDFRIHIVSQFKEIQQNIPYLQKVPIDNYDAILIRGTNKYSAIDLADLCLREAITFYQSEDFFVSRTTDFFSIQNPVALAELNAFVEAQLPVADSNAHQWVTLHLYQQLLKKHLADKKPGFLLETNLNRIEWVHQKARFQDSDKSYEHALSAVTKKYPAEPSAAAYWLALALAENAKGQTYGPFADTTHRYALVTAKQIVQKALEMFKDSIPAVQKMKNLLKQITSQHWYTKTEHVNLVNKKFRAHISYRNTDTLYIRILQTKQSEEPETWHNAFWKKIVKKTPFKTIIQALPKTDDHQLHAVEIVLPELPVGEYELLCSNHPTFNDSLNKLSYQRFIVSDISYIKNKNDIFVLNRETGKPLANISVSILQNTYNKELKKYQFLLLAKKQTDKNGYLSFIEKNPNGAYRYIFETKNDRLAFNRAEYEYIFESFTNDPSDTDAAKEFEKNAEQILFFTDRSIYRPGQSVFFKGIGLTKDYVTKLNKLLVNKDSVWVFLQNVNGKKIDSARYQMNSYGSFAGNFTLPNQGLTGSFSIFAQQGSARSAAYFSVEEYKRPTFTVTLEKPKTAYQLNDSITITGNAKAFSGNNIDGAKVVYTITRNSYYRFPWYWKGPVVSDERREIGHGTLATDASGNFQISFKASAEDIKREREGNPLFNFSINASVTDGNGETRTANTEVTTGFTSLQLSLTIPELVDAVNLKEIPVHTTNLSNEKEPALVQVRITALQHPERLIKKRFWERPDQFLLSEKEFIQQFPYDEYNNESNPLTWMKGSIMQEAEIDTKNSNGFALTKPLSAGHYEITAVTKDKNGTEISTTVYFRVIHSQLQQMASPDYHFTLTNQQTVEPGDTASFIHGMSVNEIFVIRKTERPSKKAVIDYHLRKKKFTTISLQVTEEDRGGMMVTEAYVIHNRMYTNEYRIDVPWTNKQLDIHYSSYRNKTEPGSKETWTVHIKGGKGEKTDAELLTGMYDASLDQFRPHQWKLPAIWPTNRWVNQFNAGNNFSTQQSSDNFFEAGYFEYFEETNDRITLHADELMEQNIRYWVHHASNTVSPALKINLSKILENISVIGYQSQRNLSMDQNKAKSPAVSETAAARKQVYSYVTDDMAAQASGIPVENDAIMIRGKNSLNILPGILLVADGKEISDISKINTADIVSIENLESTEAVKRYGQRAEKGAIIIITKNYQSTPVTIRKNFNETAFFYPQLNADTAGNYSFSFTMPDALTQWKWMTLAHTRDLALGNVSTNIITQKTLMVQANAPRFMREGDKIEFSAKITNLGNQELSGQISLELTDAIAGSSVDGWFQNVFPVQYFTVSANQSSIVKFPLQIPFSFNRALSWRLVAKAANFSDGEENTLAVLTNRQLVTESLPILITKDTTQNFRFEKLIHANSPSLTNEALTISYTTNPIWEAIRSLPYLMEYPYECVEQSFNRFYANTLAHYIINKDPKIKKVFEAWQKDTAALKTKLQLNQSLKQVMLEETPWVFEAETEEQKNRNLAQLFDVFRLSRQAEELITKLQEMQLPNGGFSWFKGGYADRYMTNYVMTGIGKLKRIGALTPDIAIRLRSLIEKSVKFLDQEINKEYQYWKKVKLDTTRMLISTAHIQYLYMRSFFKNIALPEYAEAYHFFYNRGKFQIQRQSIYHRALLGLVYYRNNEIRYVNVNLRNAILENAVRDSTKASIYWKDRQTYSWYQTPIEHQSTIIQFLQELQQGQPMVEGNKSIDEARNWLLLHKQTNHWKTTVATAEACYALLMAGTDILHTEKNIRIQLGNKSYSNQNLKTEAGTGYFQQRIEGRFVQPAMGNITITVQTKGIEKIQASSWGSIYWQYFEDMDKITASASPLSITKQLFMERNTNTGKLLEPVNENAILKPGDKVVIRLTIKSDRHMEYLHLKDTRASTMEPTNVLSGFKWQDGLGYYESTKDASTNFFISELRKGTYVFDYPVFITHTGVFFTGNASIQCMYAPEFTANSGGMKIRVEE